MSESQLPKPASRTHAVSLRSGRSGFSAARRIAVTAACLNILSICVSPVAAQEMGVLTGVVTAPNAAPLAQARVSISDTPLAAVTDSTGGFRVARIPPGMRTLEIKRLGYLPLALPVEVLAGEILHLQLALSPETVVLTSVHVDASAADPALRGFNARRARGTGTYFNREELDRMQPRVFTDILRRVAGVQIQAGIERYGSGSTVQMGRNSGGLGARVCPVEFFVNGTPFPSARDGNINHFIAPEDVVAVEVYAGTSQVPQEFSSGMYNTRCGIVIVWTRSGPEKPR
jgi:outer membrane receptor for Fe3+-dicitrate